MLGIKKCDSQYLTVCYRVILLFVFCIWLKNFKSHKLGGYCWQNSNPNHFDRYWAQSLQYWSLRSTIFFLIKFINILLFILYKVLDSCLVYYVLCINFSFPFIFSQGSTHRNTSGYMRSCQKWTEAKHHGSLFWCTHHGTTATTITIWKERPCVLCMNNGLCNTKLTWFLLVMSMPTNEV